MIFGSVCSGIEAASVAWHPLGWRAAFLSEIEAFPRAVLKHHYPEVPLHGDFTTIRAGEYEPIDLLVGGTPCQSFSVAGLRGGLDDDRGNLALEYLRLADRLRPRWLVWENVPGVYSSTSHVAPDCRPPDIDLDAGDGPDDGQEVVVEDSYDADESHAFSCFLAGLSELGYGYAYRTLDAQFFGVPQRRRRVFVVGYLGDWRRAAAVLFERHSLSGHPAPRRQAGEGTALSPTLRARANSSHRADTQAYVPELGFALNAKGGGGRIDGESETFIAFNLRGREGGAMPEAADQASLRAASGGSTNSYVAFNITPSNSNKDYNAREASYSQAITGNGNRPSARGGDLITGSAVRRLTPVECARLQGFPDDYLTSVPWRGKCPPPDGPMYKALGNSMAVPCMVWLGQRIAAVEALCLSAKDAA